MKIGASIFVSLFARAGLPAPVAEYRFAKPRRFAFDYAWPDAKVALEVEGGLYGIGKPDPFTGRRRVAGHGSIQRLKSDMEKYNIAAMHGWRVLRCTVQEFERGDAFQLVCNAFKLLGVVE